MGRGDCGAGAMVAAMTPGCEHLETEIYLAIEAWLECAPEKRPSPQALGQRIAEIAAALERQEAQR
jgi:hypothetical protein